MPYICKSIFMYTLRWPTCSRVLCRIYNTFIRVYSCILCDGRCTGCLGVDRPSGALLVNV
jgi:hypothetical protein